MQAYYRWQSRIYNSTRWSFLFGRRNILNKLPFQRKKTIQLLEVGSGTGFNLRRLAKRYPNAQLTGMDVSPDMIRIASKAILPFKNRVRLLHQPYTNEPHTLTGTLDVVLFSYSLTMINPQWPELIERAAADLRPGGIIAVVDFHASPFRWFRRHMGNHHVRMEGQLLPKLRTEFDPLLEEVRPAYGGIWQYLMFVGRKSTSA